MMTLFIAAPCVAEQTVTIVPREGRVSDREARHALARILSYDDATLRESLAEYRALLALSPRDPAIETEMAQVLLRLGMEADAAALLRGLYARDPGDSAAAAAMRSPAGAFISTRCGHRGTGRTSRYVLPIR